MRDPVMGFIGHRFGARAVPGGAGTETLSSFQNLAWLDGACNRWIPFHPWASRNYDPLPLRDWIDAAILLDIVEADADFADVLGWIGRGPEANQRVHLAYEAFFRTVGQSEPYLAVPHPCFEVVDQEQGLSINIDVDAAIASAIGAGSDLHPLQQVMEFCRPFNDGVLAQWHKAAPVGGRSFKTSTL